MEDDGQRSKTTFNKLNTAEDGSRRLTNSIRPKMENNIRQQPLITNVRPHPQLE
uniref:Uncharacterized protein n=1 Tax=Cucumis melo TaxID=3656 RepID=A0A9I9DI24_CUCME